MDNPAIEIFLIKNILLLLQIDMRHMASSTGRCDKCKLNKENIYIYIFKRSMNQGNSVMVSVSN